MGSGRRLPLSLTSHHRCQLISPWQLRNLDRNQMDRRWTARSCAANCIWPYYSLSKLGLEGGPRVWEVPPFFNKIATEISPTAPLGSFAAVGNGKWGPAGRRRGDKSCPELKKWKMKMKIMRVPSIIPFLRKSIWTSNSLWKCIFLTTGMIP